MNAQALSLLEPGQGRFERVLLWNHHTNLHRSQG
jgi:hypothetical protein